MGLSHPRPRCYIITGCCYTWRPRRCSGNSFAIRLSGGLLEETDLLSAGKLDNLQQQLEDWQIEAAFSTWVRAAEEALAMRCVTCRHFGRDRDPRLRHCAEIFHQGKMLHVDVDLRCLEKARNALAELLGRPHWDPQAWQSTVRNACRGLFA